MLLNGPQTADSFGLFSGYTWISISASRSRGVNVEAIETE